MCFLNLKPHKHTKIHHMTPLICVFEDEPKSKGFGTTWEWVNGDRIVYFWVNYIFKIQECGRLLEKWFIVQSLHDFRRLEILHTSCVDDIYAVYLSFWSWEVYSASTFAVWKTLSYWKKVNDDKMAIFVWTTSHALFISWVLYWKLAGSLLSRRDPDGRRWGWVDGWCVFVRGTEGWGGHGAPDGRSFTCSWPQQPSLLCYCPPFHS